MGIRNDPYGIQNDPMWQDVISTYKNRVYTNPAWPPPTITTPPTIATSGTTNVFLGSGGYLHDPVPVPKPEPTELERLRDSVEEVCATGRAG